MTVNRASFDTLRDQLHTRADMVLAQKRAAYASEHNVLANFKQLAQESGLSEIKVWEVLMRKALNAMIRTANGEDLGGEPAIDRFVDFVNYVTLGWALANQHTNLVSTNFKPVEVQNFFKPVEVPESFWTHGHSLYDVVKEKAKNRLVD
jgi:hypothetical protein